MKVFLGILLLICCTAVLSCTSAPQTPAPSPTPQGSPPATPTPVVSRPATESGDDSDPTFEGTAGVTERKRSARPPGTLKAVRTARHENFDRVVFEFFESGVPGYHIEYIDKPIRNCGEGRVVPLSGTSVLRIRITPANAHTQTGEATIIERERVLNLPVMKELKLICDFEADVQFVLGISQSNPYRVLELSNPSRLVVDIRH